MKKQTKQNEEIAKLIQREQVISYKKKPGIKVQKQSDDEIESANSLKSGVFSEDSDAKFSKKNTPLPQLYREKQHFSLLRKRIFYKNLPNSQPKQINNYLEKEVRQHDNLVLKQKNNHLTTENMKLKTRIMNLQKQLAKSTKTNEDEGQKPKPIGIVLNNSRVRGNQIMSLKMTLKNLRKQLDEQKKQNEKIKFSVKFTRINQLQCQRDQILQETARLRQMLQDQYAKKVSHKIKEQGLTSIQQKYQSLSEKNNLLMKQNNDLKNKIKNIDQTSKKFKVSSENEKNLSKMLFNAKRLIKQKQRQIESLKVQSTSTQPKIQTSASINMNPKSQKQVKLHEHTKNKSSQKRVMSKSAQKYRKKASQDSSDHQCKNCVKHKETILLLQKKIEQLNLSLKNQKQNNLKIGNLGQFSKEQIESASNQQIEKLSRFLIFRFKAHHLSYEEAQKYLINGQINEQTKKQSITVSQMAQSLVAQPFSILSSRYLEVCLLKLFYFQQCQRNSKTSVKLKINENKKMTKGEILFNFNKMMKPFEIMSQQKQQEMFIQIAQLVTNYHQHILTALNRKRNGEGTISQLQLTNFFNEIQLQKQFVDFIICQIILESLDLQHLNFYTMFEIFYMPTQAQNVPAEPNQPNKKKFQVDHSQIVKQQDEQYQQSKSHLDTKQKTQSKRDEQQQYEQENIHSPSQHSQKPKYQHQQQQSSNFKQENRQKRNQSLKNVEAKLEKQKLKQKKQKSKVQQNYEDQQYEQLFQQQKMNKLPQQEKANEDEEVEQQQLKPYDMQEAENEYKEQFN